MHEKKEASPSQWNQLLFVTLVSLLFPQNLNSKKKKKGMLSVVLLWSVTQYAFFQDVAACTCLDSSSLHNV